MTCLVLRLAGPLQSWGNQSQFNRRETFNYPTKSGVIGLLAAADGRRREDTIADLLELRFGIRVDQEGIILRDYHTVSDDLGLRTANVNKKGTQDRKPDRTNVTARYYLQDAVFVAVVEGPEPLLQGLGDAIRHPQFPLALGRRACPPTQPIVLGVPESETLLWDADLTAVLATVAWQASFVYRRKARVGSTARLLFAVDDPNGADRLADVPTTFSHQDRRFTVRSVTHGWVDVATGVEEPEQGRNPIHDPLALLGW